MMTGTNVSLFLEANAAPSAKPSKKLCIRDDKRLRYPAEPFPR